MAGRPCTICYSGERSRLASEMIAAGATDQAIADRIGGINRMTVSRHRHNHVLGPARAIAEAAGKGQEAAAHRNQAVAAAEAGDPLAFVQGAAIVGDLRRVHDRLERTADAAEQDKQRLTVASLSAQQLRAAEVRAKIGGVGGYAPGKAGQDGSSPGVFSVTINLGDGRVERITGSVGRMIEGQLDGAPTPDD